MYCWNSNEEKSFVADFIVVIYVRASSTIYSTIINCSFHNSIFASELEVLQQIVEPNTIPKVFVGLFSTLFLVQDVVYKYTYSQSHPKCNASVCCNGRMISFLCFYL